MTDCADGPSEGWAGVEGGLRGIVFISFNRHISTLTVDEPLECITVDCSRVAVEGGCFQAFEMAHLELSIGTPIAAGTVVEKHWSNQ